MKDSEILKKAKALIKKREYSYICCAIWTAGAWSPQSRCLINWVEKQLEGNWCYEKWLSKHSFRRTERACYYGRLAWLNWMIAYCEKEEENK